MKFKTMTIAALAGATLATTALADQGLTSVATLTIDVSGFESWDDISDSNNLTGSFILFPSSQIIGIGWDVQIVTSNSSWLSEPTFEFQNSDSSEGIYLSPGVGSDQSGTQSFSSGGMIDLVATGQDFFLLDDSKMDMELFEVYDDDANVIDATFGAQSTVWIQYTVPTPGSLALLGLGGAIVGRRRR